MGADPVLEGHVTVPPPNTKQLEATAAVRVGLVAATIGIASTLATGLAAWGGIGARVATLETEIDRKADVDAVADLKADIREVRVRIDRVLDAMGSKR